MIYDKTLKGKLIELRQLELSDCTDFYVNMMNDKEINKYLESRWSVHTVESIKEFVLSIRESTHSYFFAIIYENRHVGNIKLGPIHPIYKCADVGYLIGDKSVWGKGIATEAIGLVTKFAFEELNLNKLQAGAFEQNIGSRRALIKNAYKEEGIFRKKWFLTSPNDYSNLYEYGILKSDFERGIKYE